jgi:hypothetical protein
MKTLKSLLVFSILGVVSLVGCGGVNDAEMEGTLDTTEQATCATPTPPIAGCTLIGPVNCSAGGNHYSYLCQTQPYGCKLFRDTDCTWSGHTDGNCAWFQANFCS